MKKKLICMPKILKNISYILIPIFVVVLISSIISIMFVEETDRSIIYANSYYDTQSFKEDYLDNISRKYYLINENEFSGGYTDKQSTNIGGKDGTIYYNTYVNGNFRYLIVNKKTGIATTNLEHTMKTDTIDEIIGALSENSMYWNYTNGKIDTNFSNLTMEEVRYESLFTNSDGVNDNFEIYTVLLNKLPYNDDFFVYELFYNFIIKTYKIAPLLIVVSLIVLITSLVLIIKGIGKTKNEGEISLNCFDRWKLGFVLILGMILIHIGAFTAILSVQIDIVSFIAIGFTTGMLIIYLTLILMLETIVKRIKSHTLIKSTICYSILKGVKSVIDNRNIATKLILYYGLFCILGFFFTSRMWQTRHRFMYSVLLLSLGFLSLWYLFCKLREFEKISEALKSIYEGNTNIQLNPNEQKGVLKELSIYIQDIAGGLSNAVNESLKSERLKTELITNVSHDIKTPLTSIINYVDLLKKEKMPNEKCTEYLMILDNKSQRLKRLTEDLVEASKASSGNIKLKMEQINVVELVKQVSGEFEDRFKKRGLQEVMALPEESVIINADGRYLYRVLENIYSNVAKYAMENTRVYLDVVAHKKSVTIQMKNISQDKLNISADELMQRFVRGEASRNTEGSGLGLSIASSLTELQGGKFDIYLDGDLFKVTIEFERI